MKNRHTTKRPTFSSSLHVYNPKFIENLASTLIWQLGQHGAHLQENA